MRGLTDFEESAYLNNQTYLGYYLRLKNIAVSRFKWNHLPERVHERFMETILYEQGHICWFRDEILGDLTLPCALGGWIDMYRTPTRRDIISESGYHNVRFDSDSVVIFDNRTRTVMINDLMMYARRLYNIDRTIDVNVNAQKTPIIVTGPETQKMTLRNLYKQYDGNEPVIYGYKNLGDSVSKSFQVLKTDAPFVSPQLYQLRMQFWNEALTYLGVPNTNYVKNERMVSSEVQSTQGGVFASRLSPLKSRQDACEQINQMFGLNISVEYDTERLTSAIEQAQVAMLWNQAESGEEGALSE